MTNLPSRAAVGGVWDDREGAHDVHALIPGRAQTRLQAFF
jgi:hypothetical protein